MNTIRTTLIVALVSASSLLGLLVTGTACAAPRVVQLAPVVVTGQIRCEWRPLEQGSGSVKVCSFR